MSGGTGRLGEDYTAQWLISRGYRITAKNFHSRYGEIDIIAEDEKYIVFVEVKTRCSGGLVTPLEAVTPQKQRKILLTAQAYLAQHSSPLQPRFDVAAVTTVGGKPLGMKYYENAFGA